ncbi:MAG: hypothetical protein HY331_02950 [Chloroflexi bacterium]|nr:hypothetical protein [Chloroflexota bacterium]
MRASRQVNPDAIPGDYAAVLNDDEKDTPVLKTALAVSVHEDGQRAIAGAHMGWGCFIVSSDRDFTPGRNVWGWTFIRPDDFWVLLRSPRRRGP